MKRTGIALLAATLVLGVALGVSAAPVTTEITIFQGWNLISMPTVPLDPAPEAVFGSSDVIDGKLYRWNPLTASLVGWDVFSTDFGNILIADGYWVYRDEAGPSTVSYQGVDVSGDHWISLPRAGWSLIGYPNNTPATTAYENLLVTNGIVTKSMTDAVNDGWISDICYTYNNATSSLTDVGLPQAFPTETDLGKNKGYWFFTNQDNLALIVPGA